MKPFRITFPILKYDDETGIVEGFASVEEIDKQGEIVRLGGAERAFEKLSDAFSKATDGMSLGPLREMHQPIASGKLIWWGVEKTADGKGGIKVAGKVVDETARMKCRERIYTGFSIGGNPIKTHREKIDGQRVNVIDEFELVEVSLVDNPACPSALFTVVKRAEPAPAGPVEVAHAVADALSAAGRSLRLVKSRFSLGAAAKVALEKGALSRSELMSIMPALEALAGVCGAIDAEFFESSLDGDDGPEAGDIAVLTQAAESLLEFIYNELQEQLRSLSGNKGVLMTDLLKELGKLTTLMKALTPAQFRKVADDPEFQANMGAMHKIGHALVKATYDMGGAADCKVTNPHGTQDDEAAPQDGGGAPAQAQHPVPAGNGQPAGPAAPAPNDGEEPEKEKAAVQGTPGGSGGGGISPSYNEVIGETPGMRPSIDEVDAGRSPGQKPSEGEPEGRPVNTSGKAADAKMEKIGRLDPEVSKVLDELKGLPALMKSMDGRLRAVEKQPGSIGRSPVAAAEKSLPGSVAAPLPSSDLDEAIKSETDPVQKAYLIRRKTELSVKTIHAAGVRR